jgi:hypothetical protein
MGHAVEIFKNQTRIIFNFWSNQYFLLTMEIKYKKMNEE